VRARFLKGSIPYHGAELNSLWAYRNHGVRGDSIVAFIGPCEVKVESLVDLEDAKAGAFIYSPKMLHLVAEHFELDLEAAILRQYLLVGIAQDELNARQRKARVVREGNDLYVGTGKGRKKLSVSIATLSPVSSKIHFGINIQTEGAPVPALGLKALGIDPKAFGDTLLRRYVDDHRRMAGARTKVRGVL
jgi:hypothetical protein